MSADRSSTVLVTTGGHPFEEEPFLAVFDALPGITWQHASVPGARDYFRPERAGEFDAIVCYDMQGIERRIPDPPLIHEPPAEYAENFVRMLEAGQGIVFLHHALTGWPAWPVWAEVLGGRNHYIAGELDGRLWPPSGYTADVPHRISCIDPSHPICAGVEDGFEIVDEVLLGVVREDRIVPLFRTDFDMSPENFYSFELGIRGRLWERDGWTHPRGSSVVGWVKTAGVSPIAYFQPGHGPSAYANPGYRRVLSNAIAWVGSAEAHRWAAERATAFAV
jgi:type 1 glutamine amidotransferase